MSNSRVNERWLLLTFASLILVVVLFIKHSPPVSNNISLPQNLKMPTLASSSNQLSVSSELQSGIPLNKDQIAETLSSNSQIPSSTGSENSKPAASLSLHIGGLPADKADEATPPTPPPPTTTTTKTTSSSYDDQQVVPVVNVLNNQEQNKYNGDDEEEEAITREKEMKNCNIYEGKWVYDPIQSPLYDSAMCPFFSDTPSCRRNGRPDREYEKWRWEAKDCTIPRFNAKDMLERLRGKRVVIVGDSLGFGQFESLACLLYSAIPDKSYVDVRNRVFRAESYDLVIQSYWAPFLVELLINKTDEIRILKLDSLDSTVGKWKDANIMLFNTGHWWRNPDRWDWFQYKKKVFTDMEVEKAFKAAMKTWARWIEKNVDTSKTTVYFRSISPEHFGNVWCYESTKPILDESYIYKNGKSVKEIVEKTIQGMKAVPVKYLNITKLSEYRPDAHPSIYGTKEGKLLIATKQKPPTKVADCSHWCLPGVPDTWNHLLYATMVF